MQGSLETAAPPSQELHFSLSLSEHLEICDTMHNDSGHMCANKCLIESKEAHCLIGSLEP